MSKTERGTKQRANQSSFEMVETGRKNNEWKSEEENNDISQPVHKSQASLAQPLYVLST